MAKNRNKKRKNNLTSMNITSDKIKLKDARTESAKARTRWNFAFAFGNGLDSSASEIGIDWKYVKFDKSADGYLLPDSIRVPRATSLPSQSTAS